MSEVRASTKALDRMEAEPSLMSAKEPRRAVRAAEAYHAVRAAVATDAAASAASAASATAVEEATVVKGRQ